MTAVAERGPAKERTSTRKSLMSNKQILLMNFGFFGIQYSFGMQQTAVNPVFTFLHADPGALPILNVAGPICGLFIQPLIGAMSDRTWSPRWGRRKPFFIVGAIGCSVGLFLFPFVTALWMAVLLLWILDASNNTAMEPYRAFLADKLDDSQLAKGFLTQAFFTGFGITLANFSLTIFQGILKGTSDAGIPYWVFGAFMLGAVCSIGSVLVSVLTTKEIPPSEEELAELRARPKGLPAAVKEIASAVRDMPASLHKLGLVYLFQWYAIVVYWQFVALAVERSLYGAGPGNEARFGDAVAKAGQLNGTYNIVTFCSAFFLVGLARRFGAKWVHAVCISLAGLAMLTLPHISNPVLLFAPMLGLGIAWASMMGVPYIMAVSLVPKERYGVYMGIINMMIVVPMLIQAFTFGWIYKTFLGSDPRNALVFSGILFFCAAIAMTWIRAPKKQSNIIPLTLRTAMRYERVLVGSDGTDASLHAVERAAEIAGASDAGLVIACAYSPASARAAAVSSGVMAGQALPEQVRGREAAVAAVRLAATRVNETRVKSLDKVLLEGDPAEVIVDAALEYDADLIVVGNRGLNAIEGQLLGSVPAGVASRAACDVLIVQTERPGDMRMPTSVPKVEIVP